MNQLNDTPRIFTPQHDIRLLANGYSILHSRLHSCIGPITYIQQNIDGERL